MTTDHPASPRPTRVPFLLNSAAVLGAGAWGTALASALQRAGVDTQLWGRRHERIASINDQHLSAALPGTPLPPDLRATQDLRAALDHAQVVILAVPAAATRALADLIRDTLSPGTLVLSASKGFEPGTGALMSQVLDESLRPDCLSGALTGPSFAAEVARGEPTLLTLAMTALDTRHPRHRAARRMADALSVALGRAGIGAGRTPDVVGAQVGGALKNQTAIACGMALGLGLGENARAGILTRGLDDMRRLTEALGGSAHTLLASCGVGDLFLTAASQQSRNTRLGLRLGSGNAADVRSGDELAEGATSAATVAVLEAALGIRLHVATAVREVLNGVNTPAQAIARLLEPCASLPEPDRSSPPTRERSPLPVLLCSRKKPAAPVRVRQYV